MVEGRGGGYDNSEADGGQSPSIVRHSVLWPYSDSFSTQYFRTQSSSNLGSKTESKAGSKTGSELPDSQPSRSNMSRMSFCVLFLYGLALIVLLLWVVFFGTANVVDSQTQSQTQETMGLIVFYLAVVVIWLSSGMLAYLTVITLWENGFCAGCYGGCHGFRGLGWLCGIHCCTSENANGKAAGDVNGDVNEQIPQAAQVPTVVGFISHAKTHPVAESPC
jgi:hypothetical protein